MKLIFNIEPLFGEPTGVGIFTLNLLRSIAKHPKVSQVHLFAGHRDLGPYTEQTIENIINGNTSIATKRRFALTARLPDSLLWTISRMIFALRTLRFRDYIYIETNSISRPFIGKTLLFCHDLSVIRYRDFHPARRVAYFDKFLRPSIKRATKVATISAPIAKEIVQTFDRQCDLVVPPGVSPSAAGDKISEFVESMLDHLDHFILTVGSLEPRKNLGILIAAFKLLPVGLRKQFPLVFVGPAGWKNEKLHRAISELEAAGEAYTMGYLNHSELNAVYRAATIYAYLSHYEGFGMPVIEAMSNGVPVLISEDPALVDTAGGAALVVDANTPATVSNAMQELIQNPKRQKEFRKLGLENIKRFSWNKSANKLVCAIAKM